METRKTLNVHINQLKHVSNRSQLGSSTNNLDICDEDEETNNGPNFDINGINDIDDDNIDDSEHSVHDAVDDISDDNDNINNNVNNNNGSWCSVDARNIVSQRTRSGGRVDSVIRPY